MLRTPDLVVNMKRLDPISVFFSGSLVRKDTTFSLCVRSKKHKFLGEGEPVRTIIPGEDIKQTDITVIIKQDYLAYVLVRSTS